MSILSSTFKDSNTSNSLLATDAENFPSFCKTLISILQIGFKVQFNFHWFSRSGSNQEGETGVLYSASEAWKPYLKDDPNYFQIGIKIIFFHLSNHGHKNLEKLKTNVSENLIKSFLRKFLCEENIKDYREYLMLWPVSRFESRQPCWLPWARHVHLAQARAQAASLRRWTHLPWSQHLPREDRHLRSGSHQVTESPVESATHDRVSNTLCSVWQELHVLRDHAQCHPGQDRGSQHRSLQQGHLPDPPDRLHHVGWQCLVLDVFCHSPQISLLLCLRTFRGQGYLVWDRTCGFLQYFPSEHPKLFVLSARVQQW